MADGCVVPDAGLRHGLESGLPTLPPQRRGRDTTQAKRAAVRLQEDQARPVPAGRGIALEILQATKRFGDRDVLRQVSLSVAPGQFVAIVGRSGCGKSTLLRLVAALETAQGGEVRLDGQLRAHRDDLRMMFQDPRLLPWKRVLDNVALGLTGSERARARQVLGSVGLADRADDWPGVLSGGQRQRVALARALVHDPRLLLLDEPLGALDALTRIEMQRLVESLWLASGFTAMLVTHDVGEAIALADRIVLIEHGTVSLDIAVPLPRPRSRGDPAFAAIEDMLLRRILSEPSDADRPSDARTFPARISAASVRWAI
jgi:sulfonate transport system ATP-binding protein